MRFLLAWLLALVGASPCHAAFDRASTISLAQSVLKIEVARGQGGYALGSGVVIADERVVTNCHVTRDGRAIDVLLHGRRWRVKAQASDVMHDLCVLQVPGIEAPTVVLGPSRELHPGQMVLALGFTGGLGLQRSEGDIVALHPLDGGRVLQVSNDFTSGASGGGLFDERLRLIGVLTFRLPGSEASYYAAPVEWLQDLLQHEGNFHEVAPIAAPWIAYWQQPSGAQPLFLQAAALERASQWTELESLAGGWSRSEADDPQPWLLRGVALAGLRRWPEAQLTLERSVLLEPASSKAWFELGLVLSRQGQLDEARRAQRRLATLNPERAAELARLIDTH